MAGSASHAYLSVPWMSGIDSDDFIDGQAFGLRHLGNDEVAALNEFGEEIDVDRGGASGVCGAEVVSALLRELQRTLSGWSRRRRPSRRPKRAARRRSGCRRWR